MKKRTRNIMIAAGVAIVGAGAVAGAAIAERGEGGGWKRGSHHGGERGMRGGGGRFGGMFDGREISKEDFEAKARARFATIDADSDGVIDTTELTERFKTRMEGRRGRRQARRGGDNAEGGAGQTGAGQRGAGQRGGRAGGMMGRIDTDGDGKVTKQEFTEHVKERFARLDLDNDGSITDADLPPRMRGQGVLNGDQAGKSQSFGRRGRRGRGGGRWQRLATADTNQDGTVTAEEFAAAADKRFARRDVNSDGAIDQADRDQRRAEAIDYRVKRFIHRFGPDADAAGKVTREQFMGKTAEMFAKLDRDGDGKVARREMRGMRGMFGDHGGRRGRGGRHERRHHRGDRG